MSKSQKKVKSSFNQWLHFQLFNYCFFLFRYVQYFNKHEFFCSNTYICKCTRLSQPDIYDLGPFFMISNIFTLTLVIFSICLHQTKSLRHGRQRTSCVCRTFASIKNTACNIMTMTQDCDLRVFPREPCGLQLDTSVHQNWETHLYESAQREACSSGRAEGRWLVPCVDCSHRQNCYWQQAVWEPFNCRHITLSREVISKCLANKKVKIRSYTTSV